MAATQPTLAPVGTFPDVYTTADELATIRPDAYPDPDTIGPHSQMNRGLLRGARASWRMRPTSVELHGALRADTPTRRHRSTATVLINEASFEELVDVHTEGTLAWRQLARAAKRPGAVPPLQIRLVNAFATPPTRAGNR